MCNPESAIEAPFSPLPTRELPGHARQRPHPFLPESRECKHEREYTSTWSHLCHLAQAAALFQHLSLPCRGARATTLVSNDTCSERLLVHPRYDDAFQVHRPRYLVPAAALQPQTVPVAPK